MKQQAKVKDKKLKPIKYTTGQRLLISGLTAFAVSFVYILYGSIDIYANNKEEFLFTFYDVFGVIFPVFLLLFAALFALFFFLFKGYLLNAITGFLFSLFASSFINTNFVNKIALAGGDVTGASDNKYLIGDILIIVFAYLFIMLALVLKDNWGKIVIFLCILITGMNTAGLMSDVVSKDLLHDSEINCDYVISNDGLLEVSEKENIIYILFDRFDTRYYDFVVEKYPDFFDGLDGFTYYDSATSLYTRTFPAATHMITGVPYLADRTPQEYFDYAYTHSDFLKDLKNNGYQIHTFIEKYYIYDDAASLLHMSENVKPVTEVHPNKKNILKYFTKLSVARNFPRLLANSMYNTANRGDLDTLSQLNCEGGMFVPDDAALYQKLKNEGLSFSKDDKNYTFLYLHGSHTPFTLDENCKVSKDATYLSQTVGSFKCVYAYLDALKKLGVYDNSTIIIAGDHGVPLTDMLDYSSEITDNGITTCMFVKPKNSRGKPVTSSAQISTLNLIPTIVKDAGIQTTTDYGTPVSDIKETDEVTRTFYQAIYDTNKHKINFNHFEITGDAKDIRNWKLTEKITSEYSWY